MGIVRKCPLCGEEIMSESVRCRFCEQDIPPEPKASARSKSKLPMLIGLILSVMAAWFIWLNVVKWLHR